VQTLSYHLNKIRPSFIPIYKPGQSAFTIVELLIVIVIIGILAAITIIAYNGIQGRASDASIQSDLRSFGMKTTAYLAEYGTLPTTAVSQLGSQGLHVAKSAYGHGYNKGPGIDYNLLYCQRTSDNAFAYIATSTSGKTFVFIDGNVKEGVGPLSTAPVPCANNGVSSITTGSWLLAGGVWVSWL
jgi:general secretion pathway protein G